MGEVSLMRMAAMMALASAGLSLGGRNIDVSAGLDDDLEPLPRERKPQARVRQPRTPVAPKVHANSREIERRLRQQAKRVAKAEGRQS